MNEMKWKCIYSGTEECPLCKDCNKRAMRYMPDMDEKKPDKEDSSSAIMLFTVSFLAIVTLILIIMMLIETSGEFYF